MASPNPIVQRITNATSQSQIQTLRKVARITALILNGIALTAIPLGTILQDSALLILLLAIPLGVLAEMALPVLVAVMAAGITHREIAGENGPLLWITPLPTDTIAEGFLDGVRNALDWAQDFGLAFAITTGIGVALLVQSYVGAGYGRGFAQTGSQPMALISNVGFLLIILVIAGGPVTVVTWAVNQALIDVAARVGVAMSFRLRDMDSASIRGIAGAAMGGLILLIAVSCSAAVWLPALTAFTPYDFVPGLCGGVAFGVLIVLTVTTGVNGWVRDELIRTIDQARARQ